MLAGLIFTMAIVSSHSKLIVADHPAFTYEGRIDERVKSQPVLIWAGSRVRIRFTGQTLKLHFGKATGQNYFDVSIDGTVTRVAANEGPSALTAISIPVGASKVHELLLYKRTEASAGNVEFRGIEIEANATVSAAKTHYRHRFEFFGDSITVGACNEDGAEDQWDHRETHNHALSYDALTSAAFRADHRAMAVSGVGVSIGWNPILAEQIWNRVYPEPDSPVEDLSRWQPDVAFVNFGENDQSYSDAQSHPLPSNYGEKLVELVHLIRAAYPETHIVVLRGGMTCGATREPLIEQWEKAVSTLEADSKIHHFVFQHWSKTHPRVSDHRAMAAELIAWLKTQSFIHG